MRAKANFIVETQETALAAFLQGLHATSLKKLAKVGHWGKYPGNVQRDFFNAVTFAREMGMEPYFIPVPVQDDRGGKNAEMNVPIFPAHEWLATLHKHNRIEATLLGPGGAGEILTFWAETKNLTWSTEHPARVEPGFPSKMLPFALFGDDARIFEHEKLLIVTLRGVLNNVGSTLDRILLLGALPLDLCIPEITIDAWYEGHHWGFVHLLTGTWPFLDHLGEWIQPKHGKTRFQNAGKELAGGLAGALVETDGDYKFIKETFHFEAYDNKECCHRCGATKNFFDKHGHCSPVYTDFAPEALHKKTSKTAADYFTKHAHHLSPLSLIPGWVPQTTRIDIMHNVFQGGGLHLASCVIITLLVAGRWGPMTLGWSMLLKLAWADFKKFAESIGVSTSQKRFTKSQLGYRKLNDAPKLQAKAFNCRVILAWLAHLTLKWTEAGHNTDTDQAMAVCCWAIADFIYVIESSDRHLTTEQAARAAASGHKYLMSYSLLASLAVAQGSSMWPLKPKLHQFDHMLDDVERELLNPRHWWNFANEDFVGVIKRIAQKCSRKTISLVTLKKYMLWVALHWMGRDRKVAGTIPCPKMRA